jgi:hypothetical protein
MIAWLSRVWAYFVRALREATTARDNHTTDLIRVTGLAVAIQFIWLAAANWDDFDPTAYATGAGIILSALGVAMRVARPTEPEA